MVGTIYTNMAGVEGKAALNQGRGNGKGWDHTGALALLRPLCLPHLPRAQSGAKHAGRQGHTAETGLLETAGQIQERERACALSLLGANTPFPPRLAKNESKSHQRVLPYFPSTPSF